MSGLRAALVVALVVLGVVYAAAFDEFGGSVLADQTEIEDLTGTRLADAAARFGAPASEDEFTMSTGVSEFRIELRNIYDDERLDRDPPTLRETTWTLSPEQNLTLWFEEQDDDWRAVHQKSWHPEDEF